MTKKLDRSIPLSRMHMDDVLWMYAPENRYFLETRIEFPYLQSKIWFSRNSTLYKQDGKNLIDTEELSTICDQAALIMYRHAMLNRKEGFPELRPAKIRVLRDLLGFERSTIRHRIPEVPRISNKYVLTAKHNDIRNYKGNYYLNTNVTIDDFFNADVEYSMIFDKDVDRYTEGSVWDF